MRKLLIVSILLPFIGGCESLRRIEVWKQQTFFSPAADEYAPVPQYAAPQFAAPQFVGPPAESPEWTVASPVAPDAEIMPGPDLGSAEEVDGILEQP